MSSANSSDHSAGDRPQGRGSIGRDISISPNRRARNFEPPAARPGPASEPDLLRLTVTGANEAKPRRRRAGQVGFQWDDFTGNP